MSPEEIRNQYFNPFQRLVDQSFQNIGFGSDLEAGSQGSAASFRASDPASYVSGVLATSPVSWSQQFPDEVAKIQILHNGEAEKTVNDLPITGESLFDTTNLNMGSDWGISGLTTWIQGQAISIGVFGLAIVLILGGFLVIALSNQTVRQVVSDAAKDAAKAAAAA